MTTRRLALRIFAMCVCTLPLLAADKNQQPSTASSAAESLPTGMSITPLAPRGSTFEALNPGLPDRPQFTADHPITTALSPDGTTLLILTSGFNRSFDAKGKAIPAQSNE